MPKKFQIVLLIIYVTDRQMEYRNWRVFKREYRMSNARVLKKRKVKYLSIP